MSNTSSYAIMRVGKRLKTNSQIAACDRHNSRTEETPNVNAARSVDNECFVGNNDKSLVQLVHEHIGDNGGKKIRTSADPRQSAVLAFELMLSASPEYFRPDSPGAAGAWQAAQLQRWEACSAEWLMDVYGSNVVRATFHRDESTPHIHAVIVPLNAKGHLNARDYVGNKEKLSALQDSYATAMKPLGLTRGIRGSKVQHEKIKDYYKSVSQAETLELPVEQLRMLAADRQRQMQKRDEFERTALTLSAENLQLKQQLAASQAQVKNLNDLLSSSDVFREISLSDIALELGMQRSELDSSRWYSSNCSIEVDGQQFRFVGEAANTYGAIDLIMHIESCSFRDGLAWLERQFGAGTARAAALLQAKIAAVEVNAARFILPVQSASQWPAVRRQLMQQLFLPSTLIDSLYTKEILYADIQGRATFVERDVKGVASGAIHYEKSGQFTRSKGSLDNAAFSIVMPDNNLLSMPQRVVIVSNPVEALSKLTLERSLEIVKTQYQSVGGHNAILELTEGIAVVEISTDDSAEGERVAMAIQSMIPRAICDRPTESHQATLKGEISTLKASMALSTDSHVQDEPKTKAPERRKDNGLSR